MIDLSNKFFETASNEESERLLRMAVAQGYDMPKGLKSLIGYRIFKFTGFPYKVVSVPEKYSPDSVIMYADAFGDENSEMQDILKRSAQFCKTHGYNMLRIYIDEGDSSYHGNAFSKTADGGNFKTEYDLSKPIKVTMQDIEKRFGFPVEIVP